MKTNLRDDALHPDHRKDASGGRALRTATPRAGTRLTRGNEAWSDNGVVTAMPCQGPNSPSRQAFRIWCQSIQRLGKRDDWILRQRVITPTTHRTGSTHSGSRRRYQVSFSHAVHVHLLARSPLLAVPRVPIRLPLPRSPPPPPPQLTRTAQLEVSSSPPRKARPARPRSCLLLHACTFSRPSSAAFPLANLLPHPRSARLLLQPYQLRLSFHYTLIPAHVPAFPSSQPCAAYRRSG